MMVYTTAIYESWYKKQVQKYEQLFPKIEKYLKKDYSIVDIGIGKAWFEGFLSRKGYKFKRIVGIDVDRKMIEPEKKDVEYHITENYTTKQKFDLLICFDTLHLIKEPLQLLKLVKKGGYALFSVPVKFRELLHVFDSYRVMIEGEIGKDEKDYFVLIKL